MLFCLRPAIHVQMQTAKEQIKVMEKATVATQNTTTKLGWLMTIAINQQIAARTKEIIVSLHAFDMSYPPILFAGIKV